MLQLAWLWPWPQILIPDWKGFPTTNTLAYQASSSAMKEKSFITLTPGVNVIKLFFFFVANVPATVFLASLGVGLEPVRVEHGPRILDLRDKLFRTNKLDRLHL